MTVFRHDTQTSIGTDLDPIEDLLNFMATLKSKGYTTDLLKEKHGFLNTAEIHKTAKLIQLHISSSIGLAEQAFSGPAELSFLPLYYSTLNINKILLLVLGKRIELESNRWHGASYKENQMSKNFLNEEIYLKNNGTIPLVYKTLTGKSIPKSRQGLKVKLSDIYPYISSVGAEYSNVTNNTIDKLMYHSATIIKDDANGHYLKVEILDKNHLDKPPGAKTLKAYPGLSLINNTGQKPHFETKRIKGNFSTIELQLKSKINRYLNSDHIDYWGKWISMTPINGKNHVFNEELCITLAFFHMSNVVRYNPEHLNKIMDSRYWSVLLGLRKHGYLTFLKLMWGNINKQSFDIS